MTILHPFSTLPVVLLGIIVNQVKNLAFDFVELQELGIGPPLQTVKVLLEAIFSSDNQPTQLGVIGKLAKSCIQQRY